MQLNFVILYWYCLYGNIFIIILIAFTSLVKSSLLFWWWWSHIELSNFCDLLEDMYLYLLYPNLEMKAVIVTSRASLDACDWVSASWIHHPLCQLNVSLIIPHYLSHLTLPRFYLIYLNPYPFLWSILTIPPPSNYLTGPSCIAFVT